MAKPITKSSGSVWEEVAASQEFKDLVRAKLRIVIPATLFFIVYYFALPILVGYAPALMERKVIGNINLIQCPTRERPASVWADSRYKRGAEGQMEERCGRVVEQRRRAAPAGRRQSGSDQGNASPG